MKESPPSYSIVISFFKKIFGEHDKLPFIADYYVSSDFDFESSFDLSNFPGLLGFYIANRTNRTNRTNDQVLVTFWKSERIFETNKTIFETKLDISNTYYDSIHIRKSCHEKPSWIKQYLFTNISILAGALFALVGLITTLSAIFGFLTENPLDATKVTFRSESNQNYLIGDPVEINLQITNLSAQSKLNVELVGAEIVSGKNTFPIDIPEEWKNLTLNKSESWHETWQLGVTNNTNKHKLKLHSKLKSGVLRFRADKTFITDLIIWPLTEWSQPTISREPIIKIRQRIQECFYLSILSTGKDFPEGITAEATLSHKEKIKFNKILSQWVDQIINTYYEPDELGTVTSIKWKTDAIKAFRKYSFTLQLDIDPKAKCESYASKIEIFSSE